MTRYSLKIRLLSIQMITVLVALGLTGLALTYLFERHVERRISAELDTYITQIAARLSFKPSGVPLLNGKLADPRFEKIYSGLYWQINNETAEKSSHSRSLWDITLLLPVDTPGFGKVHIHTTKGPKDTNLLIHERRLIFKSALGDQTSRIIVAIDLEELRKMRSEFSQDVAVALLLLAAVLLIAGWIEVMIGLKPLSLIQKSIAAIRSGQKAQIDTVMPLEVTPLVDEVNSLLASQQAEITKAKNRADNLAHGFKTPLTALKSDARRLRDKGEDKIASDIEATIQLMHRQIERELTKARIRHIGYMPIIAVCPLIQSIVKTLQRTPAGKEKKFQINCPHHLHVQIDKDDMSEVLGNLLENAVKYAHHTIKVDVLLKGESVKFQITDDGVGISDSLRDIAQERGVRLDEAITGSGLGLAIVNDVLEIYQQDLELKKSALGGLEISFHLPLKSNTAP